MTDIMTALTIADGDVFRWHYRDEKDGDRREWGRYHCKSRIAIAKNGCLRDTFWFGGGSDNATWTYSEAQQKLVLERLGNLFDLEKRPEYEAMYYADADIVDLNHANSSRGNFYIRKGAERSREKMCATLLERIAAKEREIRFAQDRLDRAREQLAAIERGDDLNAIYL
jgi:hypothetical protein